MLIKKENTCKKENSPSCTVWEYDFWNQELWFAIIEINGRFPDIGKVINHESNELFYVFEGKWIIHHETWNFEINPWDSFFCEKGKRYWIEWEKLKASASNSPARYLQQFENIPW